VIVNQFSNTSVTVPFDQLRRQNIDIHGKVDHFGETKVSFTAK